MNETERLLQKLADCEARAAVIREKLGLESETSVEDAAVDLAGCWFCRLKRWIS